MRILDTRFHLFGLKFGIDPFWISFRDLVTFWRSTFLLRILDCLPIQRAAKIYWRMARNILLILCWVRCHLQDFSLDLFYRVEHQKSLPP